MDIKAEIRKFALANAFEHGGKAQAGAIIGKLIGSKLISKDDIRKVMPDISKVTKDVNSIKNQEAELKKLWPEFFNKEEKKAELRDLPNAVMGKVITRMPPEPGKYMLAGHAITFFINYLYAQKYKGKCVLRFEDTNPEKVKQEYVNSFIDGVTRFMKVKPFKTVYESDDIEKMYDHIEKLIKIKKAYACSCPAEKVSELRGKKLACEHRTQNTETNLKLWSDMLAKKFKESEIAIRLVGNMTANNATLRDPVIARINYAEHYRKKKKYCVWPTFDFASACEDEWCGVTHILRSIEFGEERVELEKYMAELLGFKDKTYIQYGRFSISGLEKSSGRAIRAMIEKGARWDDPRMPTLAALERRGFVRETFKELAKQVGLSKTPTMIDERTIAAINRKFIDLIADRYSFVRDPIEISISGAPTIDEVSVKTHPDKEKTKLVKVGKSIYLAEKDFEAYKNNEVRLKDLYNIKLNRKAEFTSKPNKDIQKLQWVSEPNVNVEVLMPDGKLATGLGEKSLDTLKESAVIQFERFGFCKLEKKSKDKMFFVFGHQ